MTYNVNNILSLFLIIFLYYHKIKTHPPILFIWEKTHPAEIIRGPRHLLQAHQRLSTKVDAGRVETTVGVVLQIYDVLRQQVLVFFRHAQPTVPVALHHETEAAVRRPTHGVALRQRVNVQRTLEASNTFHRHATVSLSRVSGSASAVSGVALRAIRES